MPSEVVLPAVYAALKSLMAGYAPLTSLIATKALGGAPAIYDEGSVPQSSVMPYITIGLGTQIAWHTMGMAGLGRWGWNCTVQIKPVGQGSEASGLNILSQVAAVLAEGTPLNLAGYGSSWCDEFTVQPTIVTTSAGVTTREWPAILRVYCHDQ